VYAGRLGHVRPEVEFLVGEPVNGLGQGLGEEGLLGAAQGLEEVARELGEDLGMRQLVVAVRGHGGAVERLDRLFFRELVQVVADEDFGDDGGAQAHQHRRPGRGVAGLLFLHLAHQRELRDADVGEVAHFARQAVDPRGPALQASTIRQDDS